ncbi:MAG: TIR domain-containing protein [Pseudonocardiaceae bacterium]
MADERWATWIAGQLEVAGYRTLLQAWDFVPGTNFIHFMDRGVRDSAVVMAVLSRKTYGEDVLITGAADGTVRIWDAATGRPLDVLEGHERWSWPVVISPSGAEVATGDADGVLRLWDMTSCSLRSELPAGGDLIFSLAFSGHLIATAYRDGSIRCGDTSTGVLYGEFSRAAGSVYRIAFSPTGDMLAAGEQDGELRLWNPPTRRQLCQLQGHAGWIYTLAFHPNFSVSPERAPARRLKRHSQRLWTAAFSPAGGLLATGGDDGTTRLWSITGDEPVARMTLLGLPEGWAALAPDGRYKLEGNVGGQFWNVINMCRFETGELDSYLPEVWQLTLEIPF